jgi:hypothetical protein
MTRSQDRIIGFFVVLTSADPATRQELGGNNSYRLLL